MRLTPAARISLGLIALSVTLVLLADLVMGFLPDEARWQERTQLRSAEALAIQVGIIADQPEALGRTLRSVVSRDTALLSVALRDGEGKLIAVAGEHEKHWQPLVADKPQRGRFSIPMYRNGVHWGNVEIVYRNATVAGWRAWLNAPSLKITGLLVSLGFFAYFLYLRRVLQHLDPSSVVPDRVRMAFDVLTEGVMVLDARGRVVLVNEAFNAFVPQGESIMGRRPSDLKWLIASMDKDPVIHPWNRALRDGRSVTGEGIEIRQSDGAAKRVILNCAPILDGAKVPRGCLVTLDDVTALDHANSELIKLVQKLNASQKEIERQNMELKRLATRDPMTGCYNRRAFFESADPLFREAKRQFEEMCCIMTDIDHFKRFNDQYGHTVGDQVIIAVAKALGADLRSFDLLCRYGGEEFCILLPNTTPQQALEIAERLRSSIETTAGASVRTMDGLKITASFGVATLRDDAGDLGGLIDQADEALYFSKQNGRNRVTLWKPVATNTKGKTPEPASH